MVRSVGRLVVSVLLALVFLCVAAVGTAWAVPPPNDTLENATPIATLPFTDTVDTSEATLGPEDAARLADCGISAPLPQSVWYRYTSFSNHVVVIDAAGSTFAVAGSVGTLDSCVATFLGRGRFSAQAGLTYWIALVDVGGAAGGSLQLSVVKSGRAVLRGPSGCVDHAFRARVTGRGIASVRFYLDGTLKKKLIDDQATYSVTVNPRSLDVGRHRVTARVTFDAARRTKARSLYLTFSRCAHDAVAPRFTG